jgi:hypothetical protein
MPRRQDQDQDDDPTRYPLIFKTEAEESLWCSIITRNCDQEEHIVHIIEAADMAVLAFRKRKRVK